MNLRDIANGAIQAVNPDVPLSIQVSQGYTTNPAGKRSASFAPAVTRPGNIQALSYNDIQHLEGLNIQGVRNAVYINGALDGLVRTENKGGDIITMPDGSVWLVAIVLENWANWTKVAVTLQDKTSQ